MTGIRITLMAAAFAVLGGAATAQPAPSPAAPSPAARPGPAAPAPTGARQPPISSQTGQPRRPRSYDACLREAVNRKLRGMERRRFVYRCQVGYGRPLFRRRGPGPSVSQPPANP